MPTKLAALNPGVYIAVLVLALAGTYLFKLRHEGVFACTAAGYPSDRYLGYCNASGYGDYDHGAVWFKLEPEATRAQVDAQVLFLGSSRMEFAFSTAATDAWFSSQGATHYLLGFTQSENTTFVAPLLARLKPRAQVYVIDVDRFFYDVESGPGSQILHENMRPRYQQKRLWQPLHRAICGTLPVLCGTEWAYFRLRGTGHWIVRGVNRARGIQVAEGPVTDQDRWDYYADRAEQFISRLPVDRNCVVLTVVPSHATQSAEAATIARRVGLELVNPQLQGLHTFDETHLDAPSAERWSKAFFDAAGPRIQQCLSPRVF